jgi:hypothetical protein
MSTLSLLLALLFSMTYGLRAQNRSASYKQNTPQSVSQIVCPWFTQGSAAKALGGDVSVTANMSNTGEGSCKFAREHEPVNSLEILVSKASVPTCPPNSARLTGVGNEATRCRLRESHGAQVEMVSGHVRDMHFAVTLAMHEQKSSAKPLEYSADTLQQIAEQVSGNLY